MNVWKPISICLAAALVVSLGIQTASADRSPTPQPADLAGPCFDQGNMANANSLLKQARGYLDKAEHNKGGWRVDAIGFTDKAIAASDRGCAFANR